MDVAQRKYWNFVGWLSPRTACGVRPRPLGRVRSAVTGSIVHTAARYAIQECGRLCVLFEKPFIGRKRLRHGYSPERATGSTGTEAARQLNPPLATTRGPSPLGESVSLSAAVRARWPLAKFSHAEWIFPRSLHGNASYPAKHGGRLRAAPGASASVRRREYRDAHAGLPM
jgi:hypothetical protein